MTKSKKIILLTTGLILTICLMAFFGVYALTIAKNSTFNVGVKYEPEYLVKVEMGIDGANGGTEDKIIDDKEYVEIFNSKNPVSNGMYIQSMSNDTIHINSQTLTPIGENGDVYFKITSLENETSGKDLKCVIDCGSSTADSGKLVINTPKILTIATGIDATNGPVTSSSLGMIKIKLKFSEFVLDFVDLKDLVSNSSAGLDFGELGMVTSSDITGKTFLVSNIDGLLNLSALVGKVNTTTTEYGVDYGYNNSSGSAVTFSGATIQMLDNIDCENGDNKDNFSKKFIPIGNVTNSFQGTFDGNDKTITGLYINQITFYTGLFGCVSNAEDVSNAEIKNLTMQNCKVVSTAGSVGNIVGYVYNNLIISNCSAEETEVSGTNGVGGIVGSCGNGSTVTITNCYNTGSVSGTGAHIGGIVGACGNGSTATITNCYNTWDVSGNDNVGGIVGEVSGTTTITNCYNTGSVSGVDEVGGIVGYVNRTVTITNCYNTGSVSGRYNVGGLVGNVGGTATITNCYNTGDVSGSSNVGGIVGTVNGTATIMNCYNTGSVSGGSCGGIVGICGNDSTATITNCYYLKTSSVNAIGSGTAEADSYYGTFSTASDNVSKTSDEVLAYSGNILTVLNAYVDDIQTYNGIDLKSWVSVSGGYPVFA